MYGDANDNASSYPFVTDKPIFQIMAAGWEPGPVANVSPELQAACPAARDWNYQLA